MEGSGVEGPNEPLNLVKAMVERGPKIRLVPIDYQMWVGLLPQITQILSRIKCHESVNLLKKLCGFGGVRCSCLLLTIPSEHLHQQVPFQSPSLQWVEWGGVEWSP